MVRRLKKDYIYKLRDKDNESYIVVTRVNPTQTHYDAYSFTSKTSVNYSIMNISDFEPNDEGFNNSMTWVFEEIGHKDNHPEYML